MSALPQLRESRLVHSGTPPGLVVSCSVSDTMLAGIATSMVFFFDQALDVARLAEGLAQALARVPVFAGRLREGGKGLEIVCDDAGVPMTVFDIGETLGEVIGRVTLPGSGLADHVDAPAARSGGHPLMTVRISRLADGGTAVGCSFHHAVGDMQSFMLVMRAWSASVEEVALPEVIIVEDRDAYLDGVLPPQDSGRPGIRLLDPGEAADLGREIDAAFMTGRTVQIYFGAAEADRMRQEFSAAAGRRLSATDVLCAHVVTTIRHLDEDPEARNLAIAVNIRRRLELPAGVVGNLTNEVYLSCPPQGAPEALAAGIRAAVEDFTRSHLSIRSSRAFLDTIGGRSRLADCVAVGFDLGRRTFSFNSLTRFGVYDISFEGQRPAYFSLAASITLPWTSWLVEGFGNAGYLYTVGVPARLAGRMRSPEGRAALHRFRAPDDALPALAGATRKLI